MWVCLVLVSADQSTSGQEVSGCRRSGRRNPVQITDAGREALATVWPLALATDDLTDVGVPATETDELNRLLLRIVDATRGASVDGFCE